MPTLFKKKPPKDIEPSGVIVGYGGRSRIALSRFKQVKPSRLLILLAIVVIAGVLGWFLLHKPPVKAAEHTQTLNQLRTLTSQNKYDESETIALKYLKRNLSPSQHYDALLVLGLDYNGQRNWSEGLKYLLKAESVNPKANSSLEQLIASDYLNVNDKTNAITHYQRAIDAAKNDSDPTNNIFIPGYQQIIDTLQLTKSIPPSFQAPKSNGAGQKK